MTEKVKREKIEPISLGCDFWLSERTKCANTAIVRLSRNGEELKACEHHERELAKVVGR